MLLLSLANHFGHILKLRSIVLDYLFRATHPWTLAEYALHILGEDYLASHKEFGEFVMSLCMFLKQSLRTCILVVDQLQHLVVDNLSRCL